MAKGAGGADSCWAPSNKIPTAWTVFAGGGHIFFLVFFFFSARVWEGRRERGGGDIKVETEKNGFIV